MTKAAQKANTSGEDIIYADGYRQRQKRNGNYSTLQQLSLDINPKAKVIITHTTCKSGPYQKVGVKGIYICSGLMVTRPLEASSKSIDAAAKELLERLLNPEGDFRSVLDRERARIVVGDPKKPQRVVRVVEHRGETLTA